MKVRYVLLLLAILAAAAITGCVGSAPGVDGGNTSLHDRYAGAYFSGMEHYLAGQRYFNNGTTAWEREAYSQAISDYADASAEYGRASADYETMSGLASDGREKTFGEALRQWSASMSRAASDYMESAILLQKEDRDKAYQSFVRGQREVNTSEVFLQQSADALPGWLRNTSND